MAFQLQREAVFSQKLDRARVSRTEAVSRTDVPLPVRHLCIAGAIDQVMERTIDVAPLSASPQSSMWMRADIWESASPPSFEASRRRLNVAIAACAGAVARRSAPRFPGCNSAVRLRAWPSFLRNVRPRLANPAFYNIVQASGRAELANRYTRWVGCGGGAADSMRRNLAH